MEVTGTVTRKLDHYSSLDSEIVGNFSQVTWSVGCTPSGYPEVLT